MTEQSQADILSEIRKLSARIVKLRNAKGYYKNAERQHCVQQRKALQAKLVKPHLVWSNP